jgi:hypothetical protein
MDLEPRLGVPPLSPDPVTVLIPEPTLPKNWYAFDWVMWCLTAKITYY